MGLISQLIVQYAIVMVVTSLPQQCGILGLPPCEVIQQFSPIQNLPQTTVSGLQGHAITEATDSCIQSGPFTLTQKKTYHTLLQGYPIAEACGTNGKCCKEGGFCIPGSETCNGRTITEEGYCIANYDKQRGCKCCLKPTVYMRDIENTIAYALRNRAPYSIDGPRPTNGSVFLQLFRTLNKTEQGALSNFTKALVNHLHLRSPVEDFLKCLSRNLTSLNGEDITGQKLVNSIYQYCTLRGGELPNIREWVGCKNFDNPALQQFRSYPCGVWNTFHAMTVNLKQGNQQDARRMLPTLWGMVNYFPWCEECKGNFTEMYGKDDAKEMDTADQVTMWLWFAHNKVSHRAPNTFEPNRPRSLFPNNKLCPDCWILYSTGNYSSSIANNANVLIYLKELYKRDIVQDTHGKELSL